ncbi:hypothetical protein PM026_15205 [Halorubrum ezzemoulense]|uniref:hypothetical protein n=1 Tax=Halorubrum sp. C191 TaxID=1383842 RepID=UPI001595A7B5|nr:hypothetical protein [Halorubrum sp. C191]MDB2239119.1 hypothetical protein [Halorubrum ezzemoulense]
MDRTPLRVTTSELLLECRRGDDPDVEPVRKDGDCRECADAGPTVCKFGPRWAIKHQRERSWGRIEFPMKRDRALHERSKAGVDCAAAGAN